jgi:hypothetical protein
VPPLLKGGYPKGRGILFYGLVKNFTLIGTLDVSPFFTPLGTGNLNLNGVSNLSLEVVSLLRSFTKLKTIS